MRNSNAHERQRGALARLKKQQQEGTKPEQVEANGRRRTTGKMIPLTEHDTKRIAGEIETLESRV